jgi:hypothetical protein
MKNIKFKSVWVLFLGALLIISSCSKHDDSSGVVTPTETQKQKLDRKIRTIVSNIPSMKMIKNNVHRLGTGNENKTLDEGGFSFTDPNGGFNFSSPAGIIYSYVAQTIYVHASAFGNNPNSGTVVAGPSSLDMNYTFCFSVDDSSSMGLNLFSTGAPTQGISSVIGVSGDFSALANATDSTNFGDVFHGLAFYFVYDGHASGAYDVIDWSSNEWDSTSVNNKCFAFVMDFQNGRLFLSKSGKINVNGGSMGFTGDYYQVSGFINENGEFDLTGNNLTLSVVNGFGTMGCN